MQWALDDWEQYCYLPDFSGSGLIESSTNAEGGYARRRALLSNLPPAAVPQLRRFARHACW